MSERGGREESERERGERKRERRERGERDRLLEIVFFLFTFEKDI